MLKFHMWSFQWLFYLHRSPLLDLISPITAQLPILGGWFVPWSIIAKYGKNSFLNKILSFSIPGAEKNQIFQAVQIQSLIDFLTYFIGYFDYAEIEKYKDNYTNHFHIIYLAYSLDPDLAINKMTDEKFQDFLDLLNNNEDKKNPQKYEFFKYLNVYNAIIQQKLEKNPFNKIVEKVYPDTLKYFLENKISDDNLIALLRKEEANNFYELNEIVKKNLNFFIKDKNFQKNFFKNDGNLEQIIKDFHKNNFYFIKNTLSSKAIFDVDRSQRLKLFLDEGKIVYPEYKLDFLKVMFVRALEVFFLSEISSEDKRKTEEGQSKIEFICNLHKIKNFLSKNPSKSIYRFIEIMNSKLFRELVGLPTSDEIELKANIERYKDLKKKSDIKKFKNHLIENQTKEQTDELIDFIKNHDVNQYKELKNKIEESQKNLKASEIKLINDNDINQYEELKQYIEKEKCIKDLTDEDIKFINNGEQYEKIKKEIKNNQKFLKYHSKEILISENIFYNNPNTLIKESAEIYNEIQKKQREVFSEEEKKEYKKLLKKDNYTSEEKKYYENLHERKINILSFSEKNYLKDIENIKEDFSDFFHNIKSINNGKYYDLSENVIKKNKENLQAYEDTRNVLFLQFENYILKDDFSKKYQEILDESSEILNIFKGNNYSKEKVERINESVIDYFKNSLDVKYRIKRYKEYKSFIKDNKKKEFDESFEASNSHLDGFSKRLVEINKEKEIELKKIEDFEITLEKEHHKKYEKLKNFYKKYHEEIDKYFKNYNLNEIEERADFIAKICQISRDGFLKTQNDLEKKLENLTGKEDGSIEARKYKQIAQYLKVKKLDDFLNKFQSPNADKKKEEKYLEVQKKKTLGEINEDDYFKEIEKNEETYKQERKTEIQSQISDEYAQFFIDKITHAIDIQINKYLLQAAFSRFKNTASHNLNTGMTQRFTVDILEIFVQKLHPFFEKLNERRKKCSSVDYIGNKDFLKAIKKAAVRYYKVSQNKDKKKMNHILIIGSEYDLDTFLFILQQVLEDSTVNKINFRELEAFLAQMAAQSGTKKLERQLSFSMSRDYELFGFLAVQTRLLLKTFSDVLVTIGHSAPFTDFSVYNFSGIKRRKTDILSFNKVGKWLDLIKPFFYYKKINGTILIGFCKNSNIDNAIESRFASALKSKALDFKHYLFLTRSVILSSQREFGFQLFDDNISFEEICFRVARVLRNRTNDINEMQEIIQYIFHIRAKIKSMTLDMFERVMSQ